MGNQFADGIELEELDIDPPNTAIGKVDGKWFGLFWWRDTWVFAVAQYKEHLYVNRDFCLWRKQSDWQKRSPRPTGNELGRQVKEIVMACCAEWRSMVAQKA
jgi:hypothetical protein